MAKINFKGLDDYIRALNRMKGDETATIEKSVYMGAKVIGDAVGMAKWRRARRSRRNAT